MLPLDVGGIVVLEGGRRRADNDDEPAGGIIGGVGAAPMVELAGVRLIAEPSTDAEEAQALSFKMQSNHIYSNSWGPEDDGGPEGGGGGGGHGGS